jgi:recombination protein RecT
MNTAVAVQQNQPLTLQQAVAGVQRENEAMADQFKAALPAHIPVERFQRVIMTAVQNNTDLLKCERRSLWNAAMKAAQDGLLPDGREGAIVPYKNQAQWLPMIGGLRKKVRNSGEIATWDVHAVYEKDHFEFELGDSPFIKHKPTLSGEKGKIIAVYSVATLKGGEKSRDVMSIADVEKIRTKSRGTNTPWNDPIFYPEMCKKTVARRHSKVLPMSTDLDDLIRRDDDLYDFEGARDNEKAPPRPQLVDFMNEPSGEAEAEKPADDQPKDEDLPEFGHKESRDLGMKAAEEKRPMSPPADLALEFHDAWKDGWRAKDEEMNPPATAKK